MLDRGSPTSHCRSGVNWESAPRAALCFPCLSPSLDQDTSQGVSPHGHVRRIRRPAETWVPSEAWALSWHAATSSHVCLATARSIAKQCPELGNTFFPWQGYECREESRLGTKSSICHSLQRPTPPCNSDFNKRSKEEMAGGGHGHSPS